MSSVCLSVLQGLRAAGWSSGLRAGLRPEPRRALSVSGGGRVNVFNREMKKRQKNWAASLQDGGLYDYLRDEVRHGAPSPAPLCLSV